MIPLNVWGVPSMHVWSTKHASIKTDTAHSMIPLNVLTLVRITRTPQGQQPRLPPRDRVTVSHVRGPRGALQHRRHVGRGEGVQVDVSAGPALLRCRLERHVPEGQAVEQVVLKAVDVPGALRA